MENIPVTPPTPTGWRPTNSTVLSIAAGAAAQFIAAALKNFHVWELDAETQGSLTVLIMAAVSYFHPDGGRK